VEEPGRGASGEWLILRSPRAAIYLDRRCRAPPKRDCVRRGARRVSRSAGQKCRGVLDAGAGTLGSGLRSCARLVFACGGGAPSDVFCCCVFETVDEVCKTWSEICGGVMRIPADQPHNIGEDADFRYDPWFQRFSVNSMSIDYLFSMYPFRPFHHVRFST